MEFTRRGLFGLLGGALLAKVIGPKLIAEPTPAAWEAAKRLPRNPVANTYVPLQIACSRILQIVSRELKWLRLEHSLVDREVRFGECFPYYRPLEFKPDPEAFPFPPDPALMTARYDVRVWHFQPTVTFDLRDSEYECPFGHLEKRHIEPAGFKLAEDIIHFVRREGGGEVLASGKLWMPPDVARSVLVSSEDLGLAIRAQEDIATDWNSGGRRPIVRLDMILGTA